MTTMIEKKAESIRKEIEKLETRLHRQQDLLTKKIAKAEKAGSNWGKEEFYEHRDTDMTQEQWAAYFDKYSAEEDVKETESRLENAKKRLNKLTPAIEKDEAAKCESERLTDMEARFYSASHKSKEEREREYEEWLANFKAECSKDGITIDGATGWMVYGTARNGKRFTMYGNSGQTVRSLHCYTLRIDGETIFTSGDFTTGYKILKR